MRRCTVKEGTRQKEAWVEGKRREKEREGEVGRKDEGEETKARK